MKLGVVYDPARPAWRNWSPGQLIDPYEVPDEIISSWIETSPGGEGYNTQRGCYCWGYRPAYRPQTLDGVRWAGQQQPWRICTSGCPLPAPRCPTCPPQQPCPDCPECEPTECADTQDIKDSKNWLWLAGAVTLVVGVYGVRRTMQLRKKS